MSQTKSQTLVPSFAPGDVVYLKSGGPLMTVSGATEEAMVFCYWFTSNEKSRYDEFPAGVLELAQEVPGAAGPTKAPGSEEVN